MADSPDSAHPTGATADTVAVSSSKSPLVKPSSSQSSGDFNLPPPKKVRMEEKGMKPKKVCRDRGVGGSGKDKLKQPAKQQSSSGSSLAAVWSFSPVKAHLPGPQTPTKVFKQADISLQKTASPTFCSLKPSRDGKPREKKVKGGGEEKNKRKLVFSSTVETDISNNNNNNKDIREFQDISAVKRDNGEVTPLPKGRPLITALFLP